MKDNRRNNTYAAQLRNQRMLRESDVCHICGEPGADAIDHVRPVITRAPGNPWQTREPEAPYNLKPAHHDQPNSHGDRCNRIKSNKTPDVRLTTSRQW